MERCEKIKIEKQTDNVFFLKGAIVTIGQEEVSFLKDRVAQAKRKTVRLCTHQSLGDAVQEMLILHMKEEYIRPHKHPQKTVSYHIIEGVVDMVIFDEEGAIWDIVPLGEKGTPGRNFYYRLNEDRYYTPLVWSDFLLFHETINGPWQPVDTVYAPWASEEGATKRFREELMLQVDAFKGVSKKSMPSI